MKFATSKLHHRPLSLDPTRVQFLGNFATAENKSKVLRLILFSKCYIYRFASS